MLLNQINLDDIVLNFNKDTLAILNISLAIIMYGVALDLRVEDFVSLVKKPKSLIAGLLSQFFVLPLLTFVLVSIWQPLPGLALGMFMVAACPGGNVSNFLSAFARGNAALSVALTGFSTLFALMLTPLNFTFWSSLYGPSSELLRTINLDLGDVFKTILLILGMPLVLGMLTTKYFPSFAQKSSPIIRKLSILIFAAFVFFAFKANFQVFLNYAGLIVLLVFVHNLVGLLGGFGMGLLFRVPKADKRTITIETGIQNSGLGLILIFEYFDGVGSMALIAAWWGIWHLLSGFTLAYFWRNISKA